MPDRKMFWRIIRRLLGANRGRVFVILLALGAGAAVTAALLNLQVDAKRRLTTEFRAFGANVVVAPKSTADSAPQARTLPETDYDKVPTILITMGGKSALLFSIGEIRSFGSTRPIPAVVVGAREEGWTSERFGLIQEVSDYVSRDEMNCFVGSKVAAQAGVHAGDRLFLREEESELTCHITAVEGPGSENDSNVVVSLPVAQRLTGLDGRISLIRVSFPGTPAQINNFIASLAQRLPDADVQGIRQFTQAEARIYNRISGLLSATVAIVLLLTGLSVMAAMTNVAMERKNDVGLMKAIGGATRRVLRLFLTEAALLGLVGGLIGAAAGILISMGLGKAVFGVAARPRLIVYPVTVALTIIVAIVSSYPLRRLANIRPASVFRGEA
ncbi:MAG TPA: ABC transporter permease [Candidatus Dormibacteraeota bacterium]|nr:ABC transporter permease [Candidatus Dormibacteraeota bacterium]